MDGHSIVDQKFLGLMLNAELKEIDESSQEQFKRFLI